MRIEIKSHATRIPERLREIDKALRVLFDTDKQEFEVWGRDVSAPYLMARFKELDNRVLDAVRKGYHLARNSRHPWQEHLREIDRSNERVQRESDKKLDDIEHGLRDDFRYFGTTVWPGH